MVPCTANLAPCPLQGAATCKFDGMIPEPLFVKKFQNDIVFNRFSVMLKTRSYDASAATSFAHPADESMLARDIGEGGVSE